MLQKSDRICIIGGGIVGMSIAKSISEYEQNMFKEIVVIEQHFKPGTESSTRNSNKVNSAINYSKNTLKNKLCIEGNQILYQLGAQNHIQIKKTGKLIIASDHQQRQKLIQIYKTSSQNAISAQWLEQQDIVQLDPNINTDNIDSAIYYSESGIINPQSLIDYIYQQNIKNRVQMLMGRLVKDAKKVDDRVYRVYLEDGEQLDCGVLINCAGLNGYQIAGWLMGDQNVAHLQTNYMKGYYYSIKDNKYQQQYPQCIVYGVSDKTSPCQGIHCVPDFQGNVIIGCAVWPQNKNQQLSQNNIDDLGLQNRQQIVESVGKYLVGIQQQDLVLQRTGILNRLRNKEDNEVQDFYIREEKEKGFEGLINCIGIDSPGLTAAIGIGRYVRQIVFGGQ